MPHFAPSKMHERANASSEQDDGPSIFRNIHALHADILLLKLGNVGSFLGHYLQMFSWLT